MVKHKFSIGRLIKICAGFFTSIGIISLYVLAYQILQSVDDQEALYTRLADYIYNIFLPVTFSLIWLFFNYQVWDIIFLKIRSKITYFFTCLFATITIVGGFIIFYTKEIIVHGIQLIF